MKQVHNVIVSVFDEEDIRKALIELVGLDLDSEKIQLNESPVEGSERLIKIFSIKLEKDKHTSSFVKRLNSLLSVEQRKLLLEQIDSRLDDELHFFIRLDKNKWLNNEIEITDSGECFHIKMLVASYPKSKENAKRIIKEIFK